MLTTQATKFTGKERDSESGLDNFGARYDSSNLGRFMSPDPENAGASEDDPQSWNAYAYVMNNPLNSIDPDGRADCPEKDPGTCVLVTADPPPTEPVVSFSWRVIWGNVGRAAGRANDYLHTIWDWYRTTRPNPGCLAAATASGAAFGASKGPVIGGALGLIGGPTAEVTVPGGAALGGLAGAGAGGGIGYAIGQVACRTGGGGGGGGRASGSSARLTKPQQRQTAEYLGMKEVKGLTSQGQSVFEKDGRYFSFSNTSHTAGEVFKELDRNGNRIATTDLNFNRIGP